MEKEFVTYEQALALKELGFDEPCFKYKDNTNFRPLYQQAFRWFREKYELFVDWNHSQHDNFGSYFGFCIENIHLEGTIVGVYKTYEEAELECLKKLIEIVKERK
jgi:hypothetical protein